jgi:hypothetical protein
VSRRALPLAVGVLAAGSFAYAVASVHAAPEAAYYIETVDATDRFCLPDLCPAVVGEVLVYRNSGHVTASYMKTLAPWLERRLRRTAR